MPNQQDDKKVKGKKQERRNGHAFHPIMSKGGVHEKTEKAKRKAAKHEMKIKVDEWRVVKGRSSSTCLPAPNKCHIIAIQESNSKRGIITLH